MSYRECGWCGGVVWMRRTQDYCSTRCRVAAHRALRRWPVACSWPRDHGQLRYYRRSTTPENVTRRIRRVTSDVGP